MKLLTYLPTAALVLLIRVGNRLLRSPGVHRHGNARYPGDLVRDPATESTIRFRRPEGGPTS